MLLQLTGVWALARAIAGLAKARAAHHAKRRGTRTQLGVTNEVMVFNMTAPRDTVFGARRPILD